MSISIKRAFKELNNFNNKTYKCLKSARTIIFFNSLILECLVNRDNSNNILIVKNNSNNIIIKYLIPNEYPFKPYKVLEYNFSNLNWHKYLQHLYEIIKNVNNKSLYFFFVILFNKAPVFLNNVNDINKIKCLCCSTITCGNNWSPSFTIQNYLEEYLELDYITNYTKKLSNKMINGIYNNLILQFNLNNDIMDLIIEYVLL